MVQSFSALTTGTPTSLAHAIVVLCWIVGMPVACAHHSLLVAKTTSGAERALRGIALGRKSWLFAGSDRGGQRAAKMYSLIVTTKMNDIDPQAWFADVLARIADHLAHGLEELLPWNWKTRSVKLAA